MAPYKKVIRINDRKKASVTSFNRDVWIHFQDEKKGKTLSFSKDDFVNLLESLKKIQKGIKECEEWNKTIKKRKEGHREHDDEAFMIYSEDSDE